MEDIKQYCKVLYIIACYGVMEFIDIMDSI